MTKTFTILHTNDMHSAFIGSGPESDYTPFTLHDDNTRGGYARLAALIARRKEARKNQGPVLVLDAGDYSMGTAFGAATREIGGELQLMSRMGYDATTLGNHDFDFGPDGLGKSIGVAAKAGRVPPVLLRGRGSGGLAHRPLLRLGHPVKSLTIEDPHIACVKIVGQRSVFLHLVVTARQHSGERIAVAVDDANRHRIEFLA
jgi:Calcineurin-like phosphoesterase